MIKIGLHGTVFHVVCPTPLTSRKTSAPIYCHNCSVFLPWSIDTQLAQNIAWELFHGHRHKHTHAHKPHTNENKHLERSGDLFDRHPHVSPILASTLCVCCWTYLAGSMMMMLMLKMMFFMILNLAMSTKKTCPNAPEPTGLRLRYLSGTSQVVCTLLAL